MKLPVFIYHITHIENLRGILEEGRLWAKNHLPMLCCKVCIVEPDESSTLPKTFLPGG